MAYCIGAELAHYATNEKELLAIVRALGKLQQYLYGARNKQHYARIQYKPGRENHVADALSRQNVSALQNGIVSDAATIHSQLSLTYTF